MKVYMIAEAQEIACGSRRLSDDLFAWVTVRATYTSARRALRKQIREVVEAAYEGNDDITASEIEDEVYDILKTENHDQWNWDCNDRSAVWRIIESEV